MPPTKIKSPTLIGGISQQPPHLRFANQVETAVNVVFDVATGASKRPGTELVAVPSSLSTDGDYQIFPLERGSGEGYIIIIGENGAGATTLRIFQDDGREATVNITANAQTYLDAGSPLGSDFRIASNPDLTVILNRKATAAASAGTPTATTLPIKLERTTAPTTSSVAVFDADVNTWTARASGTDATNPGFSVIVDGDGGLTDVAFYRNRLVLSGEQWVAFSQAGEYFNFYIVNVSSLVDDDALEARLSHEITDIQAFRKALVVFTSSGLQYESNSPDLLTPTTLAFDLTTRYETQDVHPIVLGSAMYFVGEKVDGSILYEYLYDDTQLSSVAADTSRHVDKLLPDDVRSIDGSTSHTTVLVLPNNQPEDADLLLEDGDRILMESGDDILLDQAPIGANELNVYRYYWDEEQKRQSAWSVFCFGDDDSIADIAVLGNYCYMLTEITSESTAYVLERLPLGVDREADTGMPFTVHLDRWAKKTGAYSAPNTTWTLDSDALSADKAVLGAAFGSDAGDIIDLTQSGTSFSGSGDHDEGDAYVGQSFTFQLVPTRMFRRDRNGAADVLGDLLLNKIGIHHFETADYLLSVSTPRRVDRDKAFSADAPANGTTRAYFGGDADDTTISIESTSPKPTTVSAIEVDANFYPRA